MGSAYPEKVWNEFLNGFVQADGSFLVSIEKHLGKEYYIPNFYITQQSPPKEWSAVPAEEMPTSGAGTSATIGTFHEQNRAAL